MGTEQPPHINAGTAVIYRAMAGRAVTLDRLYLAFDAAHKALIACIEARDAEHTTERWEAASAAQRAYLEYRDMCQAAPLDHLLESPAEEEEP